MDFIISALLILRLAEPEKMINFFSKFILNIRGYGGRGQFLVFPQIFGKNPKLSEVSPKIPSISNIQEIFF